LPPQPKDAKEPPKPQNVLSPDAALKRLLAGNACYVDGSARRHDLKYEREALATGQNPFAAVLSCAAGSRLKVVGGIYRLRDGRVEMVA